jgi:ATP-binding protein involved in chromosome partitioning
MDPRLAVIDRRLASIGSIVAVAAGKGGVGKSTVATTLALCLAQAGRRVGLLDFDFCGPSTHLILGAPVTLPLEERGIVPPEVHGLRFLSIVHYAGDRPAPLRGHEVSNAITELLAITRWGALDLLVVDLPPGLGDTALDVIRLLRSARYLIVTTPSVVALETVKKLVILLQELKLPLVGVLGNQWRPGDAPLSAPRLGAEAPLLGELPYDADLEAALGAPPRLLQTSFAAALCAAVSRARL